MCVIYVIYILQFLMGEYYIVWFYSIVIVIHHYNMVNGYSAICHYIQLVYLVYWLIIGYLLYRMPNDEFIFTIITITFTYHHHYIHIIWGRVEYVRIYMYYVVYVYNNLARGWGFMFMHVHTTCCSVGIFHMDKCTHQSQMFINNI